MNLQDFIHSAGPLALVEVLETRGSAPREAGSWMLVSKTAIFGTIGGGQLEYDAMEKARRMIESETATVSELSIPLGSNIGQCCGGNVSIRIQNADIDTISRLVRLTEVGLASQPMVYIFGAGHVGLALARSLALLPVSAVLIDSRETQIHAAPPEIECRLTAIPETEVRDAPEGSAFVVMTHDHALDFLITREALQRRDAKYVGMIGSKTKRAKFQGWLRRENGTEDGLENLACPMARTAVNDKRPDVIAAMVTAEILVALFGDEFSTTDHSAYSMAKKDLAKA